MTANDDELPDPLVVMALELESGGLFGPASIPVLYTGVGKINAAHHLTLALARYARAKRALPLVINFGTAGSPSFPIGALVACNAFVQRDMDATALGVEAGETPFDASPQRLEFPPVVTDLPQGVCGTGDSFSTAHTALHFNVVDMEAYALAKVCWLMGTTFVSVKYITDGADSSAATSWQDNLARAAEGFLAVYAALDSRREPRK